MGRKRAHTTNCSKRVGDVDAGGVANLSWAGWVICKKEILLLGWPHDPPSGVVMATCKQYMYIKSTTVAASK